MEIMSNIQHKKFALNVRRDGPQPSVFVRSFSAITNLQGELVPGYRTMNVIGVTPGRRGLLYHHLFSSQAPDFRSEPAEVQEALQTVSQALSSLKEHKTLTWLLDSGFDDIAIWRTIWQAQEHLVCRVYHLERLVSFQDRQGRWQEGKLEQARGHMRLLARVQTTLVAKRGKQPRAKKQPVEVHILGVEQDPWLLLTDWPVTDAQSAARIFSMYRQRWGVEGTDYQQAKPYKRFYLFLYAYGSLILNENRPGEQISMDEIKLTSSV